MRPLAPLIGLLTLCGLPLLVHAQTTVTAFSPEGTVKKVRQVTARFSEPMVAFGDLRLADPFVVDCPEKGSGRWIDGSNWSYDFERDVPAAVACTFTLRPGIADLAAKPLAGTTKFAFNTGGPAVVRSLPREGARIDENQIFLLALDAPATDASIAANAYCKADGVNERIDLRVLAGKERDAVLTLQKDFVQRHAENDPKGAARVAVVQCKRTLPANQAITIVWGRKVAAANGVTSAAGQNLAFETRRDFTATFSCERVSAKGPCIPFLPMRLSFSAPVSKAQARAITLQQPGGKVVAPSFDKDDASREFVSMMTFVGPFPESTTFKLALPPAMKDDAGRALINQGRFPLTIATSAQPPLVKFAARFGIIEANGERMLPVTVRNVEAIPAGKLATVGGMLRVDGAAAPQDEAVMAWLKRLNRYGYRFNDQSDRELRKSVFKKDEAAAAHKLAIPRANGASTFEVIGIPLPKPGFYVVELESPTLGAYLFDKKAMPAFVHSAALVTNLAAHFKLGKESSLVWVTSLDQGAPVAGAAVAVRDCKGKELFKGVTDASGVARIRSALRNPRCGDHDGFFVSARLAGDFTFTLSEWDEGIEAWRFNLPTGYAGDDNIIATTVFDRTLLRAGETVHMKHFLRKHTSTGVALAGAGGNAELVHEGSDERFPIKLAWKNGSAASEWTIPAAAKQGTYNVMLGERQAGSFQVEQFRVPTMRAILRGPKNAVVAQSRVDLDVQVSYLSGGGASLAPVKVNSVVQPREITFTGYDDFHFAQGDVKEGVDRGNARSEDDEECCDDGEGASQSDAPARTRSITLDKAGGARVVLDQLPVSDTPKDLLAEVSYPDANGETLTASTRIVLWPSRFVVGIKPDSWVMSKEALKFQALVLDVRGKPVAGTQVTVDFFQRQSYSHRRRLMGGFYAYENSSEVKRLGVACEGMTDAKGLLHCDVKPPTDGNLILRARAVDEDQRAAVTRRDVWIAGSSDWWFDASDNDRIDLLPVKKFYEPGEQATFQVRSPFRDATALVTVEREGILDTYVRRLSGKNPTFTIPVKGVHAPNIFVSALVVRGRVEGIKPTALVDLGKPAYKLGMAAIRVGWRAHELNVQVTADKQVYKVRETANVTVRVARADGSRLPAGTEVALAAVDEGLLELKPNDSWKLLEAMMDERSLQVTTSTAQMQVIGKRHYGRKAFPHGGGGGSSSGRELFDTLLFWKASVVVDAKGEAKVQVPLNDSLTAFRIVAIASGSAHLFGTGKTTVRSSQDLMLLSGLPALVREGDRLRAGATLRNATTGDMKVDIGASVAADGGAGRALGRQEVAIAAGQSQEIGWDYEVPAGAKALAWTLDARAVDGAGAPVTDKLTVKQKVTAAVPVRTIQAILVQLDKPLSIKVQAPVDALPGRGGLLTHLGARLGGEMPGVRDFMQRYPYTCFEQRTSRAVALRDKALWEQNIASLPAHLDSDGLVKYFATEEQGGDSLTAYLLAIGNESGYSIPAALRETMEKGLLDFVEGRLTRRSALRTADLAVRKLAALEAISRTREIKAASIESFDIQPNLWPTSAVIDWYQVLERSPGLPQRDVQLAQAEKILKARLNLQGTTMGFSTERSDDWWWLMASPDVNANRLLLAMVDKQPWQADMGRMARGTLGRQKNGHWGTTVANAWGVLAMEKFSQRHEKDSVTGTTRVQFGSAVKESVWANEKAASVAHAWPVGAQTLAVTQAGTGKPWVTLQSTAAIPLKAPLSSGYRAVKTVTPIQQKVKGRWSRGDTYRVRLDLEAQADMTWVVVDDPIPASATVLGAGLARDSVIATGGERRTGGAQSVFEERTFESFRAYYSFVPKGKWSVEYTVRLNNEGRFNLPPTHVEAMYSPEMFGDFPNAAMEVGK